MAISGGVGKHFAYASIDGVKYPVLAGHVEQNATLSSSEFSVQIPLNYTGAYAALSKAPTSATITVESVAGSGTLIVCVIDKIIFDYPHVGGGGIITVKGRDESANLHRKKSDETFLNRKTTDIVTDLCGRVGLAASIIGGTGILAGKYVNAEWVKITDGISYATVIHQCAEIDNASWSISPSGGTLNYVIGNFTTNGSYSVNYSAGPPVKGDYLTLSITVNSEANSNIQTTVKSWDPKQKQDNVGIANITPGGGDESAGLDLEYKHHIPNLTQDHVQKYAESFADAAARHAITVKTKLVGDPNIDPLNALVVNGTGAFDQSYQIDKIVHHFGYNGYTMEVTAKTPGTGRSAS